MKNEKYELICLKCQKTYKDDYQLNCSQTKTTSEGSVLSGRYHGEKPNDKDDDIIRYSRCDSLLRTNYQEKKLNPTTEKGLYRYGCWLPVIRYQKTDSGPRTYKSEGLSKELGLKNLYIGFSGYWPEKQAYTRTCTFKEYEAFPTMQRVVETGGKSLVLASAGNTGRAFAYVSTIMDLPVIVVVPETSTDRLWLPVEPKESVNLVAVKNADYFDAIQLAADISKNKSVRSEGGAKNIARRDGMGLVMVDGTYTMKRLPDHYFQAIGSGTGGISAWEASLRFLEDGSYGKVPPQLHLSQNLPFAPMYYAYKDGRSEIIAEKDMPDAKNNIEKMYTDVLSNRNPPYSTVGGVYDVMMSSGGDMYSVENDEAKRAKALFENLEGIDILPPAAVAVASLIKAVEEEKVGREDHILLNITGGGFERLKEDQEIYKIKPKITATKDDIEFDKII